MKPSEAREQIPEITVSSLESYIGVQKIGFRV